MTSFESSLQSAFEHLLKARRALAAEIHDYPTPISGCDAQFNHLLSERQRVSNALAALGRQPFVPTPRMPVEGARAESR